MELQLLLRTIAVGLLALQCSVLSVVFGLPAERNAAADRFYKATDDDRSDDYYDYDEEEKRALLGGQVRILNQQSGQFLVTTENGLRSTGDLTDSSTLFTIVEVSNNVVTVTQNQDPVGINSKGQIILDENNSSEVAHEFVMIEDQETGVVKFRVEIGGRDCYIAFMENGYPVHNACMVNKQQPETQFAIIY